MGIQYIIFMTVMVVLIAGVSSNRCINNHCFNQEKKCKEDKASLPCHNVSFVIYQDNRYLLRLLQHQQKFFLYSFMRKPSQELTSKSTGKLLYSVQLQDLKDNIPQRIAQRYVSNRNDLKTRLSFDYYNSNYTMAQLKYRINSVTSQSSRYPAQNLVNNQEGWQSAVNCQYPQSITMQFYVPIKTKKLHILFHQYKIPIYIEVYVKLGGRQKYRKLGYIRPNENNQSSFEQKQQKTLYFQFSCTHIRLVLHDNYKNDRNLFNQVSISDLIVIGEILNMKQIGKDVRFDESSEEDVSESIQIHGNPMRIMESSDESASRQYQHPIFKEVYIKLQVQKREAVERQDYQRASNIKNTLNNFKTLEYELGKLETEKNEAIKQQDYDRCHRVKNQINKKKQVIEYHKSMLFRDQEVFYSENNLSRVIQKESSPKKQSKKREYEREVLNFKSPEVQKKVNKPVSNFNYHDQQVVPALRNKGNKSSENLPLETNQKRKDIHFQVNQSIIPQVVHDNDTSIKKQLNQLNQFAERQNIQNGSSNEMIKVQLQPLENKLKMRLENYFHFIPEKVWQMCEHKNWRAKQQALKFMKEKISQIESKQHFMGSIELISRVIISKQATISIQSLHLLNKLCDLKIKFTLQHMPYFVEEILNELLNFLNDTNKQIKELAYITYLKLPQISFLGLHIVVKELIKHKNKVKNDPKLIITKLQLMNALIERYSNQEIPTKEIINWILLCFQDPNQKVRTQASELLVAVAYIVGNQKILKMIELNKPQMMQLVLNMMNTSLQHSKIHHDVSQSKLNLDNSKLNQQFYGFQHGQQSKVKEMKYRSKNNKNQPLEKPIYVLQSEQKYEIGKSEERCLRNNDNINVNLSYSKQSIFEDSIQPSHLKRQYEGEQESVQLDDDHPGICEYCNESYQNMKRHFMNDCDVLVFCEKCNGYLYLRTATEHLLHQCSESHQFVQCKKCGVAIERDEINEHIARGLCKKKRGVNWQRCQYCSSDIFGEDKFWIEHSKQCRNLPKKQEYFQGESQLSNSEIRNE